MRGAKVAILCATLALKLMMVAWLGAKCCVKIETHSQLVIQEVFGAGRTEVV